MIESIATFTLAFGVGFLLVKLVRTTYKMSRILYENFRHMG